MTKSNRFKPDETAPYSGQYEILGPRGGETGKERTVTKIVLAYTKIITFLLCVALRY